jgi:selenocysteine-specific elongation factor
MPREELKSRLAQGLDAARRARWNARAFTAVVARAVAEGAAAATGAQVHLPDHQVRFTAEQQARVETLLADLRRDPYNTPSPKDVAARLGDELMAALLEQGVLVAVSAEVLFEAGAYRQMVDRIRAHLQSAGRITVAEVRDLFSTSRKYALALMEHLDQQGVTRRVGDERVLKSV